MKSLQRPLLAGILAIGILTAVACKSGSSNSASSGGSSNQITGAGSTFVYPIMTRWIQQFQQSNTAVQINYQSIGSGGGIQQLKKGLVDFGASDAALDDQQLKEMPALVQLPESAGPVCITYNLPSLKKPLRLTPEALAGIFMGTIKSWKDKAITSANPGVPMPNDPVFVAHRSDGSGTSNIFTTYLAAVSPEWKDKVGKGIAVKWPVGVGGKGSEGVTGVVKQNPGGIGYVELTYALENNLPVAAIKNEAGNFVEPSADSASAAIDAFSSQLSADVRTPVVNPPASAKEAYPISGLTYLLIPKQGKSPERSQVVKKFVTYIIIDGQNLAPGLHYSKIPQSIVQLDQKLLDQVQ